MGKKTHILCNRFVASFFFNRFSHLVFPVLFPTISRKTGSVIKADVMSALIKVCICLKGDCRLSPERKHSLFIPALSL